MLHAAQHAGSARSEGGTQSFEAGTRGVVMKRAPKLVGGNGCRHQVAAAGKVVPYPSAIDVVALKGITDNAT